METEVKPVLVKCATPRCEVMVEHGVIYCPLCRARQRSVDPEAE